MAWILKYVVEKAPIIPNPFLIDYNFTKSKILVGALSPTAKLEWYRVGYVTSLYLISGIGNAKGDSHKFFFGYQVLNFRLLTPNYKMQVFVHRWISSIALGFWESDDPEQLLPSNQIYDGGTF